MFISYLTLHNIIQQTFHCENIFDLTQESIKKPHHDKCMHAIIIINQSIEREKEIKYNNIAGM